MPVSGGLVFRVQRSGGGARVGDGGWRVGEGVFGEAGTGGMGGHGGEDGSNGGGVVGSGRSGGSGGEAVELLPTSSTCFGTLYLPRYKDEETLERKLGIALEFGGVGFGTA